MRLRDAVWDPRKGPLIFVLATYLLGTSINLFSNAVAARVQTWPLLWWIFAIGGPLAILLVTSSLLERLLTRRPELRVAKRYRARAARGLVVFASASERGIETAEKAIEYHQPTLRKVWLISSTGGRYQSQPFASKLAARFRADESFAGVEIAELELPTPQFEDPEAIRTTIESNVYGDLPADWSPGDVIIDITGGRKTTTAGAFLAALPEGRRLEINEPKTMDEEALGKEAGDPLEIEIDYQVRRIERR